MKRRSQKYEASIPYEQIDGEIRPLIRLINEFPGIHTEFSCAGHKEEEEGYVTFRADSQDDLKRFVASLPFLSWQASVVANQFRWRAIVVDVAVREDQDVRFNLRFAGRPQYLQRQLIGEMERSLTEALASVHGPTASEAPSLSRPQNKHPRRPKCAFARSDGTAKNCGRKPLVG